MRLLQYATLAAAALAPAVWVLWPAGEAPLPAASAQPAQPAQTFAGSPSADPCAFAMQAARSAPAAAGEHGHAAGGAAPCPFAPSMAGTRPDGGARLDARAHLVVDEELAHLFDYYLSALGEQSLPAIRAGIERELRQRLPATAANEAIGLLDRYIAYKRALATVERSLPASLDRAASARSRLEAMQRLRADYFSAAEAAGLFGAADARDREAIAMLDEAQQKTQKPAQSDAARQAAKQARSGAAIMAENSGDRAAEAIAAAERAERGATVRVLTLEANVQQARSRGAADDEIYRMRASAISPEAAARLADVDREEADWQRRIAAYRAARASAPGADVSTLQQMRDAQFTPQEQKRLDAYE